MFPARQAAQVHWPRSEAETGPVPPGVCAPTSGLGGFSGCAHGQQSLTPSMLRCRQRGESRCCDAAAASALAPARLSSCHSFVFVLIFVFLPPARRQPLTDFRTALLGFLATAKPARGILLFLAETRSCIHLRGDSG